MVLGSPRDIARSPAVAEALALLLPRERLDAFGEATAVDLRHVDSAVAAGFDLGTLYLFTAPAPTLPRIVERFRARLDPSDRVQEPRPGLLRVIGVSGTTPESLLRVEDRFVAVAVGDPTLGRVVEAFARKRLRTSAPALRGAALSTLPPVTDQALATFYAPGPFSGEWVGAANGLLAQALAVSVALFPLQSGRVRLSVRVAGDFAADASDRLRRAYAELSQSSMGKLLALDQPDATAVVREREQCLLLDVDLAVAPIAEGLRAAVVADIWEILRLPEPSRTP